MTVRKRGGEKEGEEKRRSRPRKGKLISREAEKQKRRGGVDGRREGGAGGGRKEKKTFLDELRTKKG